jgi:hypothetical protein
LRKINLIPLVEYIEEENKYFESEETFDVGFARIERESNLQLGKFYVQE